MSNIDTFLEKIKTDLRAFIEEEVRRGVAAQLGAGRDDAVGSNQSPQIFSAAGNALFDLEELSNNGQVEGVGPDDNLMHDLEDVASGYSTRKSDLAFGSSAANAAITPGGNSNHDLDNLVSMSSDPIAPVDALAGAEIPAVSMLDHLGVNPSQSSPVIETYTPLSGMQNAFNFLKRVLKS